jgi:hypothetical protein
MPILTLPFLVLIALGLAVAVGLALVYRRRRRPRWPVAVVLSLAAAIVLFEATPIPRVLWDLDFYLNHAQRPSLVQLDFQLSVAQRSEVVRMAVQGRLAGPNKRGDYWLPDGYGGLSVHGDVTVWRDLCGVSVFFMTVTGFSPDPYWGFEYSPDGCPPSVDPLASGGGTATDLGGGWYWIEAS